ncbi:MAG: YCF48-related protein [Ferruginibacter sp.]
MRTPRFLLAAAAAFCFVSFQSCKKNDGPTPVPPPVIMPDTLTTGWTKKLVPNETGFGDIFFNSSTTGYLVGSKIYKSTDGGNNWLQVLPANGVFNIFMTNDSKAFFVGTNSLIIKTIDGGSSFLNTAIGAPSSDIFFIDNANGFCIAYDGLYNTIDAGVTWSKITTTGLPAISSYASLSFINNTTGWVVNQSGIYRSVGSLTNWQQATVTGGTGSYFVSVYATSATNVYAANSYGEIFRSTDGGTSFTFIKNLGAGGFSDLHFLTDLQGYAGCGRSVFKTTDGGANWSKVVSLGQGSIGELHFTDAIHGWVCGSDGVVLIFKP